MNADERRFKTRIQICVHPRLSAVYLRRRCGRCIGKGDPVDRFPVVSGYHVDRVPRTAIEKRPIRALAGALLTADTEIWVDFDSSKRRMVIIRHPEHTGFNRTILDTRRRSGAARATIGGDCEYARPFLAGRLSVALRHRPMFLYDVEHPFFSPRVSCG